MGNWYEGDICEIHDSPDECDESCGMDEMDEMHIVCGIHLFSGECDDSCKTDNDGNDDETVHMLTLMEEAYQTGTIRL